MQEAYYLDIFGPLSAADLTRDGLWGWDSPFWDTISGQINKDAITDACILLPYCVHRDNRKNDLPILTKPGRGMVATELGIQVAHIIREKAEKTKCRIIQYCINANQVGGEKANNRISFVVYGHFDTSVTKSEFLNKVKSEIDTVVIKPIKEVLQSKEADISMSRGYNSMQFLRSYADIEELLMYGAGNTFTKGYF